MASFLRQLSIKNRQQSDALVATVGTLNPEAHELSLIESIEELNKKQAEIRDKYAQILVQGASTSAQFQNAIMLTGNTQGIFVYNIVLSMLFRFFVSKHR